MMLMVVSWGEGGEAVEVRVVVRRVVAWRWRVGGGDEGDATVGMVAGGDGDGGSGGWCVAAVVMWVVMVAAGGGGFCSAFGYLRSACVDYAFRPLARCKEACHDKRVSQTCCNQEHDDSRSEQHALRTPIAGDLPGYNDLDTYVALSKSYMQFRLDIRKPMYMNSIVGIMCHTMKEETKLTTKDTLPCNKAHITDNPPEDVVSDLILMPLLMLSILSHRVLGYSKFVKLFCHDTLLYILPKSGSMSRFPVGLLLLCLFSFLHPDMKQQPID
ncbi:hypothetical protein Tco_1408757 [Tanacetum coccineum]